MHAVGGYELINEMCQKFQLGIIYIIQDIKMLKLLLYKFLIYKMIIYFSSFININTAQFPGIH